ncbi:MAG: PRC-barrel domain-containing protein [Euryarchaeota archaeon]|nr:PRC-barrel domain-containing protein [Euryarchaeota archaeon]
MRETPWTKPEALDKLHNYLAAPVFPWNILFENIRESALEHYARHIPRFHWLPMATPEIITQEVRNTCRDYLVDPDSPRAQQAHRGYIHEYPFAYSQCRIFGSLQREDRSLFDITDVPGIARLLGRQADDIREHEARAARHATETPSPLRCGARDLRGQPVIDMKGTPLGEIEDLLHEGEYLVEVRIRPLPQTPPKEGTLRHPGLRKIGDSLALPLDSITLWSPFHASAVLHDIV